jgi:hypothetical protein
MLAFDHIDLRRGRGFPDLRTDEFSQIQEEAGVSMAAVVRGLSDEQLDRAAPADLHWGAPLTVQFFIEHHSIAHPFMHLESIRAALGAGK